MASAKTTSKPLRAKICLISTVQYEHWKNNDLPRLLNKYPLFNYTRLVDVSTDKNYIWYRTR